MTIKKLLKHLDAVKDRLDTKTGINEEWLNSYTLNEIKDNITKNALLAWVSDGESNKGAVRLIAKG